MSALLLCRRPAAPPYRFSSTEYQRLFGQQVSMDALGFPCYMQRTLGEDIAMSFRIRAEAGGGTIDEIAHPLKGNSGPGLTNYAKGTAGVIRCRVFPDDGSASHFPDMTGPALAGYEWAPEFVDGVSSVPGNNGGYGLVTREMTGATRDIVEGELLHVVFENADAAPADNWYSINHYETLKENVAPLWPLSPIDRSVLVGRRPEGTTGAYTWTDVGITPAGPSNSYRYGPSAVLGLSTGAHFGCHGGYEPSNQEPTAITAARPLREAFTPDADITVVGCTFIVACEVAGRLRIEWRVNGVLIDVQTIEISAPDYTTQVAQGTTFGVYPPPRQLTFRTSATVASGQTAYVTLLAEDASVWRTKATRSGKEAFFQNPIGWDQSRGQHRASSGWVNSLPRDMTVTDTEEWWNWPIRLVLA